jgi:hypothetical protein
MDREIEIPLHRQFALEAMKREHRAKVDQEFDSLVTNAVLIAALGSIGVALVIWRLAQR